MLLNFSLNLDEFMGIFLNISLIIIICIELNIESTGDNKIEQEEKILR